MKENFDDILKRRWEERSFPIDDGHRTEMIEHLNNQKHRRAFPLWWFGGLAIVLMTGGFILYTQMGTPPVENIQQLKDIKQSSVSDKTEIAATTEEKPVDAIESGSTTSTTYINSQTISASEESKQTGNSKSTKTESISTSSLKPSNPTSTQRKHTQSRANSNTIAASGTSPANTVPSLSPSTPITPVAKTYLVDEEAAQSYTIISKPAAVIVEAEPEMEYIPNIQKTPIAAQRNSFLTPMVDPLAMDGIFYLQSDLMNNMEPKPLSTRSFYLFGELGSGLVLASEPDFAAGWKLRAGGGLGYRLSPKFQLTLAAGYLMQHGGFDFQRTSTVNTAGFGVRSNFNTLTPKTLHFVYSRIGAQFRMHRHLIAAHGGVQYLYGAFGNIVTQTQDSVVPGIEETSTDTWVKTDGLRTLLWSADIAYGYQITPRLSAMAGTDIIFSDITIEDPALTQEGYYWKGANSTLHPFVTLNYLIHGRL